MKCPKCGYLGFEATDRCRNCGYDFSLAAPPSGADLPLRASNPDLSMVDLDLREPAPVIDPSIDRAEPRLALVETDAARRVRPSGPSAAEEIESFGPAAGELPLFAPRPAGPPLAVRRPGTDVPRARRTTTARPARVEAPSLPLIAEPSIVVAPSRSPKQRLSATELTGPARRLVAGIVDLAVLASIDLAALWMTLRISGLELTREDLAVIHPIPMAGFFLVLAFLYLVGFAIGGGQTVGKMAMRIRVIGDDDQGVDLTGAVVRALGALLSACLLGLLFVPVFFRADRRAVYDQVAGTRVVVR
ncbi:MAG: RDD family protein [Acidobacteriota bacterium]|nr:RDD family protein [Acidobacteriota bacterium]